jgi:hypothetical protein
VSSQGVDQFNTIALASSGSISASTLYWLVHWGEELSFAYDDAGTGAGANASHNYPGSWSSVTNLTNNFTRDYSIYATYTASGGGAPAYDDTRIHIIEN